MELDVRVILVGRTGLDARLRLDPRVEMIRVKSSLEAVGELSDPIDEHSPRAAVVIVGADEAPQDRDNGHSPSAEFVRGLRLVDPQVRVFRTVARNERTDGADGPAVGPYDGLVDADSTAEALRAIIHGSAAPDTGPAPTAENGPASLNDPTPGSGERARPDSPAPASAPFPFLMPEEPGDSALVRVLMRGGDVCLPALDMIRSRAADPAVTLVGVGDSLPAPERGVPVDFEGRTLGYLVSPTSSGTTLAPHAEWLAGWMRLAEQQAQLREAAFTDSLTGAWNRRYFDKFLLAAIDRARAARQSITVMVFDIDDFKQFNDRFGHASADEILIETVRLLRSVIRPSDRVCRIGGDEFAVIFHEPSGPRVPGSQPPSSVFDIATRFQEQIRAKRFPKLGVDAPGRLTISGGLATFPWDGMNPDELVRCADDRALESKRGGKNAITFGPANGNG